MKKLWVWLLVGGGLGLAVWAGSNPTGVTDVVISSLDTCSQGPTCSLPQEAPRTDARVALGQKLFNSVEISQDGRLSCQSCHDVMSCGTSHQPVPGPNGKMSEFNAPTLFNVALNTRFFWDGRAMSLSQATREAINSGMGLTAQQAAFKIQGNPQWQADFRKAYPDGLTEANLVDALVAFQNSLVTPDSRFDRYLRGDSKALSKDEQEGYHLFLTYGCISCHQGIAIGGNMNQKLGVMEAYFSDSGPSNRANQGRFNVTNRKEDRHVFRVPSLRNVALTWPYLHDGSIPTLQGVVKLMARHQLGRRLSDDEVQKIVGFLQSLTGTYQG